ncbi:hypothetical protein SAMN05421819_1213 [Bryocella elongata]|uniref:NHL repeat containing protein n=1 Tax=Bryocella elongata TaxID=863522 RepID=A0A1H5UWP1_9BACT|nr:hypothetical protein [Bryocella elongata]SEF78848.1 hypothetical protein SAMN05421819_1213 [Bryocella elongata]
MFNTQCMKQAAAAGATLLCLALTGCGGLLSSAGTATGTTAITGAKLKGSVHGGQQPISGAAIHLYAAGVTGYGAAATDLLNVTVTTASDGSFNFPSSAYSCIAGQQLWIVAIGGQPGGVAGVNTGAANMAALGDCASINDSTFVDLNEVTTVGSVFALAPFMSNYSSVGASATNAAGLARAFASVNKLVNVATGAAVGSALPAGATGPTAEINTLADALSYCINSTGGHAGDSGTACGNLYTWATPSGGSAPTNTIDAALNIAHYPTQRVSNFFNSVHTGAPFSPRLTTAPSDWTMAITYAPTGISAPKSTTVDGSGNVWIANSGNNTVTVLSQQGSVVSSLSGNGLSAPASIAIDGSGNAWVTNLGGSSVSTFTSSGGVYGSSPFTGSGMLNHPGSIAIDPAGQIWIGNTGNQSLNVLNSSGALMTTVSTGVTAPTAIAIDPK